MTGEIKKRVLVTGGAGFIGAKVAAALLARDWGVVVFDNFSTGRVDAVPEGCETVRGDLREPNDLDVVAGEFVAVVHLAAATSVEESFEKPGFYVDNNVRGTINLLEWVRTKSKIKVVYASSSAVYGDVGPDVTMSEDLMPAPNNIYGLTKLDGEHLLAMYGANFGLEWAALRFFNVFGEGQEAASPYASVIPKFIAAAKNDRDLCIYGSGEQTRDFVHVDEVADAVVCALEKGRGVYNVASGEQLDINTIAKMILAGGASRSRVKHVAPVPGDATRDSGANERIRSLGWSRKADFEKSLKKTMKSYGLN